MRGGTRPPGRGTGTTRHTRTRHCDPADCPRERSARRPAPLRAVPAAAARLARARRGSARFGSSTMARSCTAIRRSTAPTSSHSAKQSLRSSADASSSAFRSRIPARSGSTCQCVNILLARPRSCSEPLSSVFPHGPGRPATTRAPACASARSARLSPAPSLPSPHPARAAQRAAR